MCRRLRLPLQKFCALPAILRGECGKTHHILFCSRYECVGYLCTVHTPAESALPILHLSSLSRHGPATLEIPDRPVRAYLRTSTRILHFESFRECLEQCRRRSPDRALRTLTPHHPPQNHKSCRQR